MRLWNTPAPWQLHGLDSGLYQIKRLNIGDWNMVATVSVSIPHGLLFTKIVQVSAYIHNDAINLDVPFVGYYGVTGEYGGDITCDATNVNLIRRATGKFDSVDYDRVPFNRGFILIFCSC